jgi:hypothetical protein
MLQICKQLKRVAIFLFSALLLNELKNKVKVEFDQQ